MNAETKNIEVTDPVTIAVAETEFKEIQAERFKGYLNDILGFEVNPQLEFSENILVSAKLAVITDLNGYTLLRLVYLAESYNQDLNISSLRAISNLQFTLKNN